MFVKFAQDGGRIKEVNQECKMTKEPINDKIQVHIPPEAIQQAIKDTYIPENIRKKKVKKGIVLFWVSIVISTLAIIISIANYFYMRITFF